MRKGETRIDKGRFLVFLHEPSHSIAHGIGQKEKGDYRQQGVTEQAEPGQFFREIHDPVLSYQSDDGIDTGEQDQKIGKNSGDQAHQVFSSCGYDPGKSFG